MHAGLVTEAYMSDQHAQTLQLYDKPEAVFVAVFVDGFLQILSSAHNTRHVGITSVAGAGIRHDA